MWITWPAGQDERGRVSPGNSSTDIQARQQRVVFLAGFDRQLGLAHEVVLVDDLMRCLQRMPSDGDHLPMSPPVASYR